MPAVSRIGDKDNKGDTLVEGSATVFAGDAVGSPTFEQIQITLPKEYNIESATPVIQSAGRYAPLDEPASSLNVPDDYPADVAPDGASDSPKQEEDVPEEDVTPSEEVTDCTQMDTPEYSFMVSQNFTLGEYSRDALFSHNIAPQGGRSVSRLVCNIQALSEVIAEKIRSEFGVFRINSGFRRGAGTSQHNKGMAMDIQWNGISFQEYLRRARWCVDNLNFDQLIFEHGNSIWIHISYNRESSTQRNQVLTMYKGDYSPGLKLHY